MPDIIALGPRRVSDPPSPLPGTRPYAPCGKVLDHGSGAAEAARFRTSSAHLHPLRGARFPHFAGASGAGQAPSSRLPPDSPAAAFAAKILTGYYLREERAMATVSVTSKGQVTIPQEVRKATGMLPNCEVEFKIEGEKVIIRKAAKQPGRGERIVRRLRGSGDVKMSTDQIMALTREQR